MVVPVASIWRINVHFKTNSVSVSTYLRLRKKNRKKTIVGRCLYVGVWLGKCLPPNLGGNNFQEEYNVNFDSSSTSNWEISSNTGGGCMKVY